MINNIHAIVMKPVDNVATVVSKVDLPARFTAEINCVSYAVDLAENIPFAHKFALTSIAKGEPVLKYGEVIGLATQDIAPGQHVHVHNLESCRGRGDK